MATDIVEAFRKAMIEVLVPEIKQLRTELKGEISTLRQEMNQRFEKMDQRFEKMDQRFENIERAILEMRGQMKTLFPVLQSLLSERVNLVERVTRLEDKVAAFAR